MVLVGATSVRPDAHLSSRVSDRRPCRRPEARSAPARLAGVEGLSQGAVGSPARADIFSKSAEINERLFASEGGTLTEGVKARREYSG